MDQIAPVLLQNGLSGVVILVLLFVVRQLFEDGKLKDKALLDEKDRRITDATAYANALAAGIQTMGEQNERLEAALSKK